MGSPSASRASKPDEGWSRRRPPAAPILWNHDHGPRRSGGAPAPFASFAPAPQSSAARSAATPLDSGWEEIGSSTSGRLLALLALLAPAAHHQLLIAGRDLLALLAEMAPTRCDSSRCLMRRIPSTPDRDQTTSSGRLLQTHFWNRPIAGNRTVESSPTGRRTGGSCRRRPCRDR